jgi:hypothetical protein
MPKFLIVSDIHFPLHSEEGLERLVETVRTCGYEDIVWNGDQLDNAYVGFKGKIDHRAPGFTEGKQAFASALDALNGAGAKRHYIEPGNHDDKPFRQTADEHVWAEWWTNKVLSLTHSYAEYTFAERYYITMEPEEKEATWPYTEKNYPSIFMHQKNYGKNPLSVIRDISMTEMAHGYAGHQHHLATGWCANGIYRATDCGTMQNSRLAGYKNNRHTRHPAWTEGFVSVNHGVPELWAVNNSQDWWEEKWQSVLST